MNHPRPPNDHEAVLKIVSSLVEEANCSEIVQVVPLGCVESKDKNEVDSCLPTLGRPTDEFSALASFLIYLRMNPKIEDEKIYDYVANNLRITYVSTLVFAMKQIHMPNSLDYYEATQDADISKLARKISPLRLKISDEFLEFLFMQSFKCGDFLNPSDKKIDTKYLSLDSASSSWQLTIQTNIEKSHLFNAIISYPLAKKETLAKI